MKLLTTLAECNWISEGLAEISPDTKHTVAHCVPQVFPSYAKIFHPIYEDLSIQDEELTWQAENDTKVRKSELQTETERVVADVLSKSTLVYGAARPGSRLRSIRWAELAGRLGIPFAPTLSAASFTRQFRGQSWPRHLIGPVEGSLVGTEREALVSILRLQPKVTRILFRFWFLATEDWKEDKVFEGTLDEAALFPCETFGVRRTPTHWLPEDRSWLVCSDYDLTFSLLGGSECLIRRLLDDPILECVPVRPDTRVDWDADIKGDIHRASPNTGAVGVQS